MLTTLEVKYTKNDIVITPEELKNTYLFGIPLQDVNGNPIPDSSIESFIRSATQQLEDYLDIIINKQEVDVSRDFIYDEYERWGFIRVAHPICKLTSLEGSYNGSGEVVYPQEWFSVKTVSKPQNRTRNIRLVPNTRSLLTFTLSVFPFLTPLYRDNIPNFWTIKYVTGFTIVPHDLINYIAKFSAVTLLNIQGDIAFGAGLSGISISLDGFSQNVNTTNSATSAAYTARVNIYADELKNEIKRMKGTYKGIAMAVS